MKKSDGDGPSADLTAQRGKPAVGRSLIARAFGLSSTSASFGGITVVPVSNLLKLALPPLFISSLPRKAIGFSFPRGTEGKLLGSALLFATGMIAFLADRALGPVPALTMVWLTGGTSVVILYNSTGNGLAFVKKMCSSCRLRPIIEEHEAMHLNGEPSEDAVWAAAKRKYSFDGLGLGTDPKIHSFCPIAKRLKESP